ncbi:MAG: tRNA pseudouridine(38-40) synthase TruA [Treponema sp.]|jgi:tRNA pseudouridine38-40 synthase|nr:tRNA pseudouridine(38-40) synthase TruA [Treponema sp.]
MNVRLRIAYDGTGFCGWQRQEKHGIVNGRTVQGTLESALERLHKKKTPLTGAGRTDAGVHAAGQVAHFHTDIRNIAPERFVPALNSLLPQDIRVLEALETYPAFHARFDAASRTYRYHLICGRHGLPQELRYGLQLWRRPRLDRLNQYTCLLHGERDCSIFAGTRDPSISRSRYIFHAGFFVQGDTLIFEITANAFLWKMVRSIMGTLLHYEERGLSPQDFKAIIESRDRSLAGPTAPAAGLSLWKVAYYRKDQYTL